VLGRAADDADGSDVKATLRLRPGYPCPVCLALLGNDVTSTTASEAPCGTVERPAAEESAQLLGLRLGRTAGGGVEIRADSPQFDP